MRSRYYGIVEKYGIPRFQLSLMLLFRTKTMNYSRRTATIKCSKKRELVVPYHFLQAKVYFVTNKSFFRQDFKHSNLQVHMRFEH